LSGCASSRMKPEAETPFVLPAGQVQVIFMRPSFVGGAVQSSVFDITGDTDVLVGIVSSGTKVRYVEGKVVAGERQQVATFDI